MDSNEGITRELAYKAILNAYSSSPVLREEDIEASRKNIRRGFKYPLLVFLITVLTIITVFFNNELIATIIYLKDLLLFTILPYIMELYSEFSLYITFP